jgi:hypothetical protein
VATVTITLTDEVGNSAETTGLSFAMHLGLEGQEKCKFSDDTTTIAQRYGIIFSTIADMSPAALMAYIAAVKTGDVVVTAAATSFLIQEAAAGGTKRKGRKDDPAGTSTEEAKA